MQFWERRENDAEQYNYANHISDNKLAGADNIVDTSPIRLAVASAGNPDIYCVQNLGERWYNGYTYNGYSTEILGNYTAALSNKHELNAIRENGTVKYGKYFIFYNANRVKAMFSGCDNHCSYVVFERKDGTWFAVVNAWFDNSDATTQQAELDAVWKRINGFGRTHRAVSCL